MRVERRKKCVSCGGPLAEDLVIVGDQFPSAIYPRTEAEARGLVASSLNLTQCSSASCGLVQLSHHCDLNLVFQRYPYQSGETATMREILFDVVKSVKSYVSLSEDDVVLDIGGNDGTLLSLIQDPVKAKVNIDVAQGIKSRCEDANYQRIENYFSSDLYSGLGYKSPKLIFSVAMFYHLSDPVAFVSQVAEVMSEESLWCIQMTYLATMLKANVYDNIVHEHVAYYSLRSVDALLERCGLSVVDAAIVPSYAGSIRLFVRKKGAKSLAKGAGYQSILAEETAAQLQSPEQLVRFNDRIHLLKETTRDLVRHLGEREGPMLALGASTKGNMICQFLGLGPEEILAVLDNSEKKIGTTLLGSRIPVRSEKEDFLSRSSYALVLPYYYLDFFTKLVPKLPSTQSVKNLIVPIPYPRFVSIPQREGVSNV